jgi:hypothetical protein
VEIRCIRSYKVGGGRIGKGWEVGGRGVGGGREWPSCPPPLWGREQGVPNKLKYNIWNGAIWSMYYTYVLYLCVYVLSINETCYSVLTVAAIKLFVVKCMREAKLFDTQHLNGCNLLNLCKTCICVYMCVIYSSDRIKKILNINCLRAS